MKLDQGKGLGWRYSRDNLHDAVVSALKKIREAPKESPVNARDIGWIPHASRMNFLAEMRSAAIHRRKLEKIDTSGVQDSESPVGTPLEQMEIREAHARLLQQIAALPNRSRDVLQMSFIQGMEMTDVAKKLRISLASVYRHRVRGLVLLDQARKGSDGTDQGARPPNAV